MASINQVKSAVSESVGGGLPGVSLGGLAIEVISEGENGFDLEGKIVHGGKNSGLGETIGVKFTEKTAERCRDSISRGLGGAAGSIVLLENCRKQEDGSVTSTWGTTAISSAKLGIKKSGHANRKVLSGFLETPVVSFRNASQKQGEPSWITFPITDERTPQFVKGHAEGVEFDREWMVEKLKEAGTSVRAYATHIKPEESVTVNTIDEATEAVSAVISQSNSIAVLRLHDQDGSVETARVAARWVKDKNGDGKGGYDVDGTIKALVEGNGSLIRGIKNDVLASEIKSGEWVLEVIPAREIPFLGDTLVKIVGDAKKPLEDLKQYASTFGINANGRVVDALMTVYASGDSMNFVSVPYPMERERYASKYIPTEHFGLQEPKEQNLSSAPAEAEGSGEYFDASQFDLVDTPVDGAEQAAEPEAASPAPAKKRFARR